MTDSHTTPTSALPALIFFQVPFLSAFKIVESGFGEVWSWECNNFEMENSWGSSRRRRERTFFSKWHRAGLSKFIYSEKVSKVMLFPLKTVHNRSTLGINTAPCTKIQNMQKILPNSLGYQADVSHRTDEREKCIFSGITMQSSLQQS